MSQPLVSYALNDNHALSTDVALPGTCGVHGKHQWRRGLNIFDQGLASPITGQSLSDSNHTITTIIQSLWNIQ